MSESHVYRIGQTFIVFNFAVVAQQLEPKIRTQVAVHGYRANCLILCLGRGFRRGFGATVFRDFTRVWSHGFETKQR